MATNSRIFAWRIPWTEEHGGLQSRGLQESDTTVTKHTHKQYTLYVYYSTIISLSNKFLKASVFQLVFGGCSGRTNTSPFI